MEQETRGLGLAPVYSHGGITIFNADCRDLLNFLDADVMVTDPPYGIDWSQPGLPGGARAHDGIQNDGDTGARDMALAIWGNKPAIVFGSPMIAPPAGTKQVLVWQKPSNSGFFGSVGGWRRDWEAIYLLGRWPGVPAARSSVIPAGVSLSCYLPVDGHPHSKPVALMEMLLATTTGTIIDPFMGSGTTMVAAKALGRKAIGIELDPEYCRTAASRLSQGVFDFALIRASGLGTLGPCDSESTSRSLSTTSRASNSPT